MLSQREGKEITISEHEDLILKIKEEAEKARAEMLNTMALFPKSTPLDSLWFVLPDCLLAVFLLNISMQSQCMLAYN